MKKRKFPVVKYEYQRCKVKTMQKLVMELKDGKIVHHI